jgi:hypothetical protein
MALEPNKWPTATRFEIRVCECCPNAHVLLFDERDRMRAQMTVGPHQIEILTRGLKTAIAKARQRNLDRQNQGEP